MRESNKSKSPAITDEEKLPSSRQNDPAFIDEKKKLVNNINIGSNLAGGKGVWSYG